VDKGWMYRIINFSGGAMAGRLLSFHAAISTVRSYCNYSLCTDKAALTLQLGSGHTFLGLDAF
jgi:hypothetical protein